MDPDDVPGACLPEDASAELGQPEALGAGRQALGEIHLHGVPRRGRRLRRYKLSNQVLGLAEHVRGVLRLQGEVEANGELDAGEVSAP